MTHAAQDHNEAVILSRLGFGSVQPAIHQMRDRAEENTIRLFDANRMELVSMLPEAEPPALRSAPRPASRLTQPIISPSRPSSLPDLSSPESASKSLNRLRVLFLDIDGVICCDEHAALDPAKLQQLARIADTTGCKVCLSSNWRFYDDLREYVYQQLDVLGIARIGTTPDAGEAESGEPKRPCEISAWMRAWNQGRRPKVQSFVAVDDRPLTEETGGAFLKGHFVQTHPATGLTERVATQIIELLLDQPAVAEGICRSISPDTVMHAPHWQRCLTCGRAACDRVICGDDGLIELPVLASSPATSEGDDLSHGRHLRGMPRVKPVALARSLASVFS